MSYARIAGIIDLELSQHLSFSFTIEENLTAPGSTSLRPNDRFRFAVWAANNSGLALKALEGTVTPSSLASFEAARFHVPDLGTKRRRQIATIEARVVGLGGKGLVPFHQIARVQASVLPDLSSLRFERSTPLVYQKSA